LKPELDTKPITDGIEALKSLVKNFPDAKVIMVSVLGQKAQVLEAIKLGAKSYIVKPIETDKFIEIIRKLTQ
jgi:two-component system chemotaxis response regulator CheY